MKILIATDGSEFSSAAIEAGCQMICDPQNTSVKVISVFESPIMIAAAPYAVPIGYDTQIEQEFRDLATQSVAEAGKQIRKRFPDLGEKLTTEVLHGSPDQAIVNEAENWGANLIVVGSHGYGFWERMFLGSVSNSVVQHAPCSVLIVRKPNSKKD